MIVKKIVCYFVILACSTSCKKKLKEDPYSVAKNYCNCIENTIRTSKDSLINIYDCENEVFPDSRFMQIFMAFDDYEKHSQSTLDSAINFALNVRNIIDTTCLARIKPSKIKKIPHSL